MSDGKLGRVNLLEHKIVYGLLENREKRRAVRNGRGEDVITGKRDGQDIAGALTVVWDWIQEAVLRIDQDRFWGDFRFWSRHKASLSPGYIHCFQVWDGTVRKD
jgi:hypothetical protein